MIWLRSTLLLLPLPAGKVVLPPMSGSQPYTEARNCHSSDSCCACAATGTDVATAAITAPTIRFDNVLICLSFDVVRFSRAGGITRRMVARDLHLQLQASTTTTISAVKRTRQRRILR